MTWLFSHIDCTLVYLCTPALSNVIFKTVWFLKMCSHLDHYHFTTYNYLYYSLIKVKMLLCSDTDMLHKKRYPLKSGFYNKKLYNCIHSSWKIETTKDRCQDLML